MANLVSTTYIYICRYPLRHKQVELWAHIHKNPIIAVTVTTDICGISQYQQKIFSAINSDHDWLIEHYCYHVCMESTKMIKNLLPKDTSSQTYLDNLRDDRNDTSNIKK